MTAAPTTVFATERLLVRLATVADAALFAALWQDPAVMTHVGFPHGLGVSHDEIVDTLQQQVTLQNSVE